MPKLHLDWSDGRYYTRPLTDEEAAASEAAGGDVVHLEDNVYAAYVRDCERDSIWQAFWRAVSNEQYMRRREKELMGHIAPAYGQALESGFPVLTAQLDALLDSRLGAPTAAPEGVDAAG